MRWGEVIAAGVKGRAGQEWGGAVEEEEEGDAREEENRPCLLFGVVTEGGVIPYPSEADSYRAVTTMEILKGNGHLAIFTSA